MLFGNIECGSPEGRVVSAVQWNSRRVGLLVCLLCWNPLRAGCTTTSRASQWLPEEFVIA